MRIVWDEAKLEANLRKHGLDFADAEQVFSGLTYTVEDQRFSYGEQRFITFGTLGDKVVLIVHTEMSKEMRVISMRKATRHEQAIYFQNI